MITEQISDMQTELDVLRSECESLRIDNAVLLSENQSLRKQISSERALKEQWMLKCTEVQTLIQQTSMSLVHGIKRFQEAQRAAQEQDLGVDRRTAPEFLREREETTVESYDASGEIVRRVSFPTPQDEKPYRFGAGAHVRTDIEDDRLPKVAY